MANTISTNRKHELPGVYNLRDVGGYRANGKTTKWGKLFRSDALHNLDAVGQRAFSEIGIKHIIDLRGNDERLQAPNNLGDSEVAIHHHPVFEDASPHRVSYETMTLLSLYEYIVEQRAEMLVRAIRTIAQAGAEEPVLVHCTAGKDRTGLVVALSLAAIGVDRDEVVDDYAATEQYLAGEWVDRMLASLGGDAVLSANRLQIISESPAVVIAKTLDRVDESYGSPREYLIRHGLVAGDIDRLAASLLVS